jgi:hypothetical protein
MVAAAALLEDFKIEGEDDGPVNARRTIASLQEYFQATN